MEAVKLVEQQRKSSEEIRETFATQNAFVIIPFQVSGIQDYTNAGYVNYQVNPEDAETFKRVWTGNDSCVLSWYKSVTLNEYKLNGVPNYSYNYQVGDYILGEITSNDSICELNQDVSYSEYTAQQIRKSVSFRVDATKKTIGDYYQLMLYKIPTYSKDTVYRLENIDRIYFNKKLLCYQLTFTSINQDLANTGKAKQQNINMSAPGQGYLNPMVMTANEFKAYQLQYPSLSSSYYKALENGEYLVGDQTKLKNRPVVSVVVKLFGLSVLNSVSFIGRPAGDTFSEYRYQRLLFPMNFIQPTTPTLYRTQLSNPNYYFGAFAPTLLYWKDFIANIKDTFNSTNKWDYEGFLLYSYTKLQQTNPLSGNTYSHSLYYENGKNWVDTTDLGTTTIWGTMGVNQTYTLGSNKAIHDRMCDNYFLTKNMVSLPLNINSTLTYGNILNAGVATVGGGIFSKQSWLLGLGSGLFLIGALLTWITKQSQAKPNLYYGIVSSPLIDYTNDLFKDSGTTDPNYPNRLLLNVLGSSDDNPASIVMSGDTMNTSIQGTLTDEFLITKGNTTQRFTTGNIGQSTFENGNSIPEQFLSTNGNSSSTKVLLKSGIEYLATPVNTKGYIIDQIQINAAFKGDISIEFLDANNQVVWSGVYQSQGKWSNSIREIWTLINTSVLNRENMFFTDQLPYPKALPEPPQDGIVIENIVKLFDNVFSYSSGGNFNVVQDYIFTFTPLLSENKKLTHHVFTNLGITESTKPNTAFNLIQNYSFTKENLLANWKTLELTFTYTADDNVTYGTLVKTFDISDLVNGKSATFQIFNNYSDSEILSGTKYTYMWSQVRDTKWENAGDVSVAFIYNMTLNLNFNLTYSESLCSFTLTQTNTNTNKTNLVSTPAWYRTEPNNAYTMYCDFPNANDFNVKFALTSAKLLLK